MSFFAPVANPLAKPNAVQTVPQPTSTTFGAPPTPNAPKVGVGVTTTTVTPDTGGNTTDAGGAYDDADDPTFTGSADSPAPNANPLADPPEPNVPDPGTDTLADLLTDGEDGGDGAGAAPFAAGMSAGRLLGYSIAGVLALVLVGRMAKKKGRR